MSIIKKVLSKTPFLLLTLLLSSLLTVNAFINASNPSIEEAQATYINSDDFIDQRRNIRTDYQNMTSQNWMGFVSGDKDINTINIPGTHDTGMRRIFAFRDGLKRYDSKAKTQLLYIDEQLEAGIRYLDLRLNNFVKDTESGDWKPTFYNCSIAHGKSSIGGTYYAGNESGGQLTLVEIIGYLRNFLTANPTETIIVSYQPETQDSVYINNIYDIAYRLFHSFFRETNPSTGRSFVYMPDGKFGKKLDRFPKLYECRGQIVLICDAPEEDPYADFPGGFRRSFLAARKVSPAGDFKDSISEKKNHIKEFYENLFEDETKASYVYDRVDQTDDVYYTAGLNTTNPNILTIPDEPLDVAEEINGYFFGGEYADSPFLKPNRRLGWITMDGATEDLCHTIYMTNMCNSIKNNMKTLQVKSGLDSVTYPDQNYIVQVGTKIHLPAKNIYYYNQRNNNNYFNGYDVNEDSYYADTTFKIENNTVVTTKWTANPRSSVEVIWHDCDDLDLYRLTPSGSYQKSPSLKVKIFPSERVIDITPGEGFFYAIHDEDITNVVPVWDRVNMTEEHPYGVDTYGQYRYEVEENPHGGLVLSLIHTPSISLHEYATIVWEDGDDQLSLRPEEVNVTVFEEGARLYNFAVTKEGGWKKYLNDLTAVADGEYLEHHLEIDEVESYEAVIDGFTITMYVTRGLLNHTGSLEFIDNDDSLRPESVTIKLYHLSNYIEEKEFAASSEGSSSYPWYFPVEACYLLETYRTEVQEIENYSIIHTSPSLHHYAVLTSLIDHSFVIEKINEIGEVEFFDATSKEKIDLARGVYDLLSNEEKALVTNYSVLTAAESTYADMNDLYQQALPVIDKIRRMHRIASLHWYEEVEEAKQSYDDLPDEAKPYVTNYSKLDDEYTLLLAMNEVALFTIVFIEMEPTDSPDIENRGTCAYTMQRWSLLKARYEGLSELAKSIMDYDYEYSEFLDMTFASETFERYDLIINTYGTHQYEDFMNRFDGPVTGVVNLASMSRNLFGNTKVNILVLVAIAGVSISFVCLVVTRKRKRN